MGVLSQKISFDLNLVLVDSFLSPLIFVLCSVIYSIGVGAIRFPNDLYSNARSHFFMFSYTTIKERNKSAISEWFELRY